MKVLLKVLFISLAVATVAGQEVPGSVVRKAPEKYPPAALAVRVSGDVRVTVEIDAEGNVTTTRVVEGHPLLKTASVQAAKEWRFIPSVNSDVRTADLVFRFSDDGWFTIEKGEVELETRTRVAFEEPHIVRIFAGTYVPKLLLLPRKNGVVESQLCPLHNHLMETELQRVHYGLLATNIDRTGFLKKFERAEKKQFPNANVDAYGGCVDNGVEEKELYFCPICRIRRSEWLKKNEQN